MDVDKNVDVKVHYLILIFKKNYDTYIITILLIGK